MPAPRRPHHISLRELGRIGFEHVLGLSLLLLGLIFFSALRERGLSDTSLAWSLGGFNLGIELAQVCVAAVVALCSVLLARLAGPASPQRLAHAALVFGIVAGTWWFVERTSAWV